MPRQKKDVTPIPPEPPKVELVKELPKIMKVKHKKSGQVFTVNKEFYEKNQHNLEIL